MLRAVIRIVPCAVAAAIAGACSELPTQSLRNVLAAKDCPADAGTGPTYNGKFLESTRTKYITVFIDGRLAKWNFNASKGGPLDILGFPGMDEVSNVHIASHKLSYKDAARKYGTCLGVEVELVETKMGNWQPSESPYAARQASPR